MWMVRGEIDGEDAYATYSTAPNGTGGGYDYGFYKSGVRLGGGTKPSIAEARQAGIDLINQQIANAAGGGGASTNAQNRAAAARILSAQGITLNDGLPQVNGIALSEVIAPDGQSVEIKGMHNNKIVYGRYPVMPEVVGNGFAYKVEFDYDGQPLYGGLLSTITAARRQLLEVMANEFGGGAGTPTPLGNDGVVAQLPDDYEHVAYQGDDYFRKENDDRTAMITPNNRVKYWETRRARIDGEDPDFDQTFANRAEAEQAVISLINTGQFAQAPAEREVPEGYAKTEGLRGQFIEIGMPENDPDAADKPYGFVQKMGNMWQEKYYKTLQSYLDGNEPDEQGVFTDKDSALNDLIDRINERIQEMKGRQYGQLPGGWESLQVGSVDTQFEVFNQENRDGKPYFLVQKNEIGGKWIVEGWDSGNQAAERRYRRPTKSESLDSEEEAREWIAKQVESGDYGNVSDYQDLTFSDNERALLDTYPDGVLTERGKRMLDYIRMVRNGGVTMGAMHYANNINSTQNITLPDGTQGLFKTFDRNSSKNIKTELLASRLLEITGNTEDTIVFEHEVNGQKGIIVIKNDAQDHGYDMPGGWDGGDLMYGEKTKQREMIDNYENVKPIVLADFLMGNTDRHGYNWMFRDNVIIPIDHGYDQTHSGGVNMGSDPRRNAERIKNIDNYRSAPHGFIVRIMARFANKESGFADLFTARELDSISSKLQGLRAMYEGMGMLDYYESQMLPRMNALLGIANGDF
jgi:hypothetical protein